MIETSMQLTISSRRDIAVLQKESSALEGEEDVKATFQRSAGLKRTPHRVLFVCLGNICRSPTAEGVLRHLAAKQAPHLALEIDSAGTADYHIGAPPDLRSQRAALRRGIDISGLQARQVAADDFARFDLILAMDRENLRELQAMQPRNSRASLQLFLDYAPDLGLRDVPDPYYRGAGAFEEVLDLTTAAARGLLAALEEGA